MGKTYVAVTAIFDTEGNIAPLCMHWEDGREFEIDRILDVRKAASMKGGGAGLRYTVRILGKERYIWREDDKWFVES